MKKVGNRFFSCMWESYIYHAVRIRFSHTWQKSITDFLYNIFEYVFYPIRVLGSDNFKSFKDDKGVEFFRLKSLRKIVRTRVKFFEPVPQLGHPSTGTSLNLNFPQLALFANFFVLPLFFVHFLILQIYERYFSLKIFRILF